MSRPTCERRHYELVAKAINDAFRACMNDVNHRVVVDSFCLAFKRDNPRFSVSRFENAANPRYVAPVKTPRIRKPKRDSEYAVIAKLGSKPL